MVCERVGSVFGERFLLRLQQKLREASISFSSDEYVGCALLLSMAVFLFSLPLGALSLFLTLLVLSILLYAPTYLSFVRSRRAERELPFLLKSLSTLLKSGLDPISSIKVISSSFPVLGRSLQDVIVLRSRGVPIERAVGEISESFSSEKVRRTLLMVGEVISKGYGIESLDRYADALLSSKRLETREFSSKLAIYTLAFIALTALAPSILIMYSILVPVVFKVGVDLSFALFVLFFVVPVLTVFLLGYISAQVG